ncbi:MAG: hypothetical protein IJ743_01990 [Bacilli bacterium]|nr:hypothetical protein [Bacilli bacterium]
MNPEEQEPKKKKRKISLVRIIFLILLVLSNTLAWFIYVTRIDNSVSVHVKSWDVVFQDGENEISTTLDILVDNIYPGMEDFHYDISAYNKSEVSAYLTYKILEADIFGTSYITKEGREERKEEEQEGDMSSAELEEKFKNDYPFSLTIGVSNTHISEENGMEEYHVNLVWPYEGKSDEEDTRWGINAANYHQNNPGKPGMVLKIKISITQDEQ